MKSRDPIDIAVSRAWARTRPQRRRVVQTPAARIIEKALSDSLKQGG